jgi:phenylacetic acid degradation operon negative regulatory protein
MKRETEEFLNVLLWSAGMLTRPTFRNLTDSYECRVYRKGLRKRVTLLERKHLVEHRLSRPADRVYRLTPQGRLHALGGRDPQDRWSREWDGRWRLVLFDVPVARDGDRKRLRRYLANRGFGYLQNSVWISPDPMPQERQVLSGGKTNVESLILMEARPCAGESDEQIVAGAWDFDQINRRYARLMKTLDQRPIATVRSEAAAKALLRWAAVEREVWLQAVTSDPLLPERILPANYLGKSAWRRRVEVLRQAGQQLRCF